VVQSLVVSVQEQAPRRLRAGKSLSRQFDENKRFGDLVSCFLFPSELDQVEVLFKAIMARFLVVQAGV